MHKVLDEEATEAEKQQLEIHLNGCRVCREHFEELQRTVAIVQSTSRLRAPEHFKESVLGLLPEEKRASTAKRWLQGHPVLTAAALFLILMTGYLFSLWEGPQQVSVLGKGHVKQSGDIVIVPKGEVIRGDLVVRNSNLKIEGKVEGDVTVINGAPYLASAGHVTGQMKEVNQIVEWIWYQMKHLFTGFILSVQ
jgi:anti-sigma factor RsiW